jgi:hypothetical protein
MPQARQARAHLCVHVEEAPGRRELDHLFEQRPRRRAARRVRLWLGIRVIGFTSVIELADSGSVWSPAKDGASAGM